MCSIIDIGDPMTKWVDLPWIKEKSLIYSLLHTKMHPKNPISSKSSFNRCISKGSGDCIDIWLTESHIIFPKRTHLQIWALHKHVGTHNNKHILQWKCKILTHYSIDRVCKWWHLSIHIHSSNTWSHTIIPYSSHPQAGAEL